MIISRARVPDDRLSNVALGLRLVEQFSMCRFLITLALLSIRMRLCNAWLRKFASSSSILSGAADSTETNLYIFRWIANAMY